MDIKRFSGYLDDSKRSKVLRYREFDEETPDSEEDVDIITDTQQGNSLIGKTNGGKQNLTIIPMTNIP
jgi:hypothetical protein